MTDYLAVLTLNERVGDVGLAVRIDSSALVGARAVEAELEAEGGLDAVDT